MFVSSDLYSLSTVIFGMSDIHTGIQIEGQTHPLYRVEWAGQWAWLAVYFMFRAWNSEFWGWKGKVRYPFGKKSGSVAIGAWVHQGQFGVPRFGSNHDFEVLCLWSKNIFSIFQRCLLNKSCSPQLENMSNKYFYNV